MRWVTRDFVHLDRVASPWLIRRFVDPAAEFVFVPWGEEASRPADATPFAIPGVELGPHDAAGTTFDKILAKYALDDPALRDIAHIVRAGVAWVLHGERPAADDALGEQAFGLLAISEGMTLAHGDDAAILAASFGVYDALYANFRAHHLVAARGERVPPPDAKGPTNPIRYLRGVLAAAASPAPTDPNAPRVTDVAARRRWELVVAGTLVGFAEYSLVKNAVMFTHTEILPGNEGKGYGSILAKAALEDVVRAGKLIIPICPFIKSYIERHPEYLPSVREDFRTALHMKPAKPA